MLITAVAYVASGCRAITGCDAIGYPGIDIAVRDAQNGLPAASSAILTAAGRDKFGDTVTVSEAMPAAADNNTHFTILHGRAGVYALQISKEGYHTWTRSEAHVGERGCRTETLHLTAALEPL